MTEGLYERYKDALRRGHVAALRGQLDAALGAYREAAEIAPDRPVPHVSIGSVELRRGNVPEALAAFETALEHAPRDEAALAARADALARSGRRVEAADTLDLLADVLAADGRLPDACDTARRALELAESRDRRRQVRVLSDRLAALTGDTAADGARERAIRMLDLDPIRPGPLGATPAVAGTAPEPPSSVAPEVVADTPAAPAMPDVPAPPSDLPTALAHTADAEVAADAGDRDGARIAYLEAAAVHDRGGRTNAALDACYRGLAVAPDDPDIHLALIDLYLARGWRGPAADKLALLGRLVELTGDTAARDRLCAIAAARFPDDPRLSALCA